ncbi:unnamed protein product [Allacma fusca]|uniref:Uncharacterized protein n=1 Tax=Allacma fusca TaxID=39272 RepID=A0A8J2PC48_9HEXA|nr:unnamed protein product [Allacma fusca]
MESSLAYMIKTKNKVLCQKPNMAFSIRRFFSRQVSSRLCQASKKRKIVTLAATEQSSSLILHPQRFQDLLYKRENLITQEEIETWRGCLPQIIQDLVTLPGFLSMPETNIWMEEIIKYNSLHGKGIRAFQVILADKYLCKDSSPQNVQAVNVLAWLIELGQSAACVVDDIMDESETRRDRMYGESRDVRNATRRNFEMYNLDFYKTMMRYKNGYYTFYSPVATVMIKNGLRDSNLLKEVEELALDIGLVYSIQDDFMDCFVDPKLMGKIGTDIEEGKCTWLFVNALEKCSIPQRRVLLDNYGSKDQERVAVEMFGISSL